MENNNLFKRFELNLEPKKTLKGFIRLDSTLYQIFTEFEQCMDNDRKNVLKSQIDEIFSQQRFFMCLRCKKIIHVIDLNDPDKLKGLCSKCQTE